MTIFLGSRYENSVVDFINIDSTSNAFPVVFYEFSSLGRLNYIDHSWVAGDRLDALATLYYRDPEKWWIIVEANPKIEDFTAINPGTILRIPNV